MRIVLDTASFVTAIRSSDGAAGALLRMIFSKRVVPLMDLKLGLEYRDVSLRAEHLKVSRLSGDEVLELIEAIEAFAEPVEVVVKMRPLSPDPDDDMVLDIAVNGRADALITNNTKDFAAVGDCSADSGGDAGEDEDRGPQCRMRWRRTRSRSSPCG